MEVDTVSEETQKEGTENAQAEKVTITPSVAQTQDPVKKPRREDRNRKDDKNLEQFTKAINAASTPEEKLNIATQKYAQMLDDNKKMQFYIKQSDKRHALILKEKEQLQLEFNKAILLKSKLENLCRELQKQNKSIKDESMHKIREEEERRKETQVKFQTTLAEISTLLQQNNEKNTKLRDDNISMTEKFKTVVQQYQLREDQVEKMSKQMDLESQLNAAKMQKASLEHQAEKERLLAEMEHLKLALLEYRAKVNELQGTETELRGQLAVYTDKYDEFQSALMKSNQVFGGFKEQMEKMSKTIKKLQKESASWKQRWERSQSALLDMCGERQTGDANLLAVQRQLASMHSLCRMLQAERTILLNALKEHNIERPPLPTPAPAPEPPAPLHSAASDAKVDAMAANCAQLRQSLAHLQSQLNVLTTQQTPQPEVPAQQEKPKKSKSKKNRSKKLREETTEESSTNDDRSENITPNATNQTAVAVKPTDITLVTENVKTETENATIETDNATDETGEADSLDLAVEKVDVKVLESLMEAINSANVNLCDLQMVGDDDKTIEEVLENSQTEIEPESQTNEDASPQEELNVKHEVPETPEKVESPKSSPRKAKESPKASPKKTQKTPNPVTEIVVATTDPVVKATESVLKATELVVKATEPVVKATEPVVKATEPVVKATEPVVKATEPVVKATEPVKATDVDDATVLPELVPISPGSDTTPSNFSETKSEVETAQN